MADHASLWSLRLPLPPLMRKLVGLGAVVLVILVWAFLTRGPTPESRLVSPVVLPSPLEVLASARSLVTERALLESIAATLWRVVLGFGDRKSTRLNSSQEWI